MICTGLQLQAAKPVPVYLDVTKPIEQRVENALSLMTLEEKVAVCHAQSKFSSIGVPRLGIPEIWMSDGPHGVREEISWDSWSPAYWTNDSCTAYPALTCLAASFNPEVAYEYGLSVGEEARYREKDILLGPGVNIYRTPMNGRNFEYMGEDPFLSSVMVVPYIKGVQQMGVSACVKHFALNNQEVCRDFINVHISDRALYEIYLPAFKAAVQKGKVWSIMGSYNLIDGQHACHNDRLLNKILKKDWKFDGVVVSDWGGAHETKQAALNGLDIEMGSFTNGLTASKMLAYDHYYLATPFLKMLKNKEIPVSVLDDKVRRILRLTFRTNLAPNRPFGKFVCQEHSQAARRVASEGIVLLKNDKNMLPIQPGKYKRIAVIGENATRSLTTGGGSSSLKVKYEISPLEGLKAVYGAEKIVYSMGYASGRPMYGQEEKSRLNADSLIADAVNAAKGADAVLFIGGLNKNHYQDCEGGDRLTYHLPFGQDKLISELVKANKNLAVIILSGNAVAMPWVENVPAIVQGWYLGSESGHALADVLSGAVNPSGKLPFSFPKKLEDNAAHSFGKESYPGDSVNQYYKEDILVGYRWFDTKKIAPLFAFGHGLSYTTFDYGKLGTDKNTYKNTETIKLSLTLKNSGATDGAEVVQVYATQKKPSVLRPAKELKAFKKVFLKAGESKLVEMEIPVKEMAFYDEKIHDWKIEPGEYQLKCAASSADVKSSVSINVE
ncbi:MAG: glycoside hydrolase family 3 C-terminal domain-containing protein [Bacteroidales bacterium]|nr:glycoside hydrolase family 3 C-terminal domain-containing protein [Bacteroidales bacterium]